MSTWREHELNFLAQKQCCEIVVSGMGRQVAYWDATFRLFWIDRAIPEPVTLEQVREWRPI